VSIESELKKLILNEYKSLREFAIIIDMPYSTLDSVLKRGVNKANVSNIIKICKQLGISAEALGEEKIVLKGDYYESQVNKKSEVCTIAAHHDGEEFTEEELEDIENFKKYVLSKRKNKE